MSSYHILEVGKCYFFKHINESRMKYVKVVGDKTDDPPVSNVMADKTFYEVEQIGYCDGRITYKTGVICTFPAFRWKLEREVSVEKFNLVWVREQL